MTTVVLSPISTKVFVSMSVALVSRVAKMMGGSGSIVYAYCGAEVALQAIPEGGNL